MAAKLLVDKRPVGNEYGNGLRLLRLFHHIIFAEQYLAGCGLKDTHHGADSCGLPRAVGTEKAKDLAGRHFDVEIVDGGEFAVMFGQLDELNHANFRFSILDCRISGSHLNRQCKVTLFLQNFNFKIANELQDIELAVDFAFEKFHVRDVGRKLIEHRVDGDPFAELDLGPGVIVKRAAQVDDADDGLRRYSRGARQGVEEHRVLVAIASLGLENFERV